VSSVLACQGAWCIYVPANCRRACDIAKCACQGAVLLYRCDFVDSLSLRSYRRGCTRTRTERFEGGITNYQLPNGLIKVRRRWGQCHPQVPPTRITLHGAKPIYRDMTSARILGHDKPCTAPVQRGPQAVPREGLGGREGGSGGGGGGPPPQPRSCRALRACLVRDGRRPLDLKWDLLCLF
jgi:hypothetical protein